MIRSGDSLYRQCVFPAAFSKSTAFLRDRFWHLVGEKGDDVIETSVAWQRLAPSLRYVHGYGCRLAQSQTSNMRASGQLHQPPRIYCGAYQFNGDAVRALKGAKNLSEVETADVVHRIENNGELAHAALIVRLRRPATNIEATKTAIIVSIWAKTVGPLRHVCACDKDLGDLHPSLKMEDAPKGTQEEHRRLIQRVWHQVRFQFDRIVWGSLNWIQKRRR